MNDNFVGACATFVALAALGCGARSELRDDTEIGAGRRKPQSAGTQCPGFADDVARVGGSNWELPLDVAETPEGDIVVAGYAGYGDHPNLYDPKENLFITSGVFATRLGCHPWEVRRDEPIWDPHGVSVAAGTDGSVLIAINTREDATATPIARLWSIDETGQERFERAIEGATVNRPLPLDGGGFIVGGTFKAPIDIDGIAVAKETGAGAGVYTFAIDASGRAVWGEALPNNVAENDPAYGIKGAFVDGAKDAALITRGFLYRLDPNSGVITDTQTAPTGLDRVAVRQDGSYAATTDGFVYWIAPTGITQLANVSSVRQASVAVRENRVVVAGSYAGIANPVDGTPAGPSRGGTFALEVDTEGNALASESYEDTDPLPPYVQDADGPGLLGTATGFVIAAGFRGSIDVNGQTLVSAGGEDAFVARIFR